MIDGLIAEIRKHTKNADNLREQMTEVIDTKEAWADPEAIVEACGEYAWTVLGPPAPPWVAHFLAWVNEVENVLDFRGAEVPDRLQELLRTVFSWTCGDCNCRNEPTHAFCYRCGAGAPESEDEGEKCMACGSAPLSCDDDGTPCPYDTATKTPDA